MVKVSVTIKDESYKELASLSDFFSQDIKKIIIDSLDVVGEGNKTIMNLSKQHLGQIDFKQVYREMLGASMLSTGLFYKIPELLGVKGLVGLNDFEFDLDENTFAFRYAVKRGSNLFVDSFEVTLEKGVKTFLSSMTIEVKKASKKSLDRLEEIVNDHENLYRLGKLGGFNIEELDDFEISIDYEDDEYWTLRIHDVEESIASFPSIKLVSDFVKRILQQAGIKQSSV